MARLQILELPEGAGDERPPFALVVDQVDDEAADEIARWPDDIASRLGARQVLCFGGTIDIPANDTTAYLSDADGDGSTVGAVHVRVEPDFEEFRQQVQDEILRAQDKLKQAVNSRA